MSEAILGTGRRKSSVARVRLTEGTGEYTFNGKTMEQYFPSPNMRMRVNKPFNVVEMDKQFDLHVTLNGSGLSAQADAVALGISRALIQFNPELIAKLKKAGLLTRDSRKVERKKYGLKKARRAEQFTKR